MGIKKINGPFQIPWASAISGPFTNNIPNSALNVGTMSGTNTIYCQPQNVQNFDNLQFQFSWTGTPSGVITFAESADGVVWDDLTLSPVITQPSGSAGHWSVNFNQIPAPWLQIRYVNSTGSGVLTAKIFSKDVN